MTGTRSKGNTNLTDCTDDPEKISKEKKKITKKRKTMTEPGITVPRRDKEGEQGER